MNDPSSDDDLDYHHRHRHETRFREPDSDPEEADIDDLRAFPRGGPPGFFGRRAVFRGPERYGQGSPHGRAAPDSSDDIIRSFTEMLGSIGGPTAVGRSGPETLFPGSGPRHIRYQRISGPGFTGGVSSFTITTQSGNSRVRHTSGPGAVPGDEEFQRYVSILPKQYRRTIFIVIFF